MELSVCYSGATRKFHPRLHNYNPSTGDSSPVLAALFQFGRFIAVVPPGIGNTAEIVRLRRRAAEHVPIGDPMGGQVPVRDPVAPCADDAVKRATGSGELVPRLGGNNDVDEGINCRIGDAGEILSAPGCGGSR